MRALPLLITAAMVSGCGISGSGADLLDKDPDKAPIESYVLALPPFAFHEETVADFRARVMSARSLPPNSGRNPDFLYCGGDGSYPAREFTLDRTSHTLTIKTLSGEGPTPGNTVEMKRVAGTWIRVSPPN